MLFRSVVLDAVEPARVAGQGGFGRVRDCDAQAVRGRVVRRGQEAVVGRGAPEIGRASCRERV